MTYANPAPDATPTTQKKTMAVLSLVFGIVSVVLSPFFPILWILMAIAAVILGFLSRKRENARTMALVGIILGFVGIAANIASMVVGAMIAVQTFQG
ncbi:DUF4190 domain-containing protein [Frigoribacterium sp. CFBP9039]|uniref:DUF4190 domain-containing protein n=1 Tax=unclassified Frigoribacterium TaxID=2627005 RepID=UPI002A6AE93E|nr:MULTISPECIES: DUF4190 domain-containing protein [unclassified Frigoribacterium]MDY0892512.1 DUF4190 domain-containing protein [Frigoribacterium sp. CFBP9030]MDY0946207.1 DUF4190 domain-containing protein [Frigoribacterium sp. CFBP9039]